MRRFSDDIRARQGRSVEQLEAAEDLAVWIAGAAVALALVCALWLALA